MTMEITVNGSKHVAGTAITVAGLLRELSLEPIRVAVEVNEDIVPRARFAETTIREGDRVEVVTFVGGG